ncbi:MAG: hypothetical protein MHM6MM_008110 [Cercozoa sp. M6MM]
MANASEKRRTKEAAVAQKRSYATSLVLMLLFCLRKLYLAAETTRGDIIALVVFAGLYAVLIPTYIKCIRGGLPVTYYQDVLWLTWFVQAMVSLFSNKFYLVGLLVPAYAAYKFAGVFRKFF